MGETSLLVSYTPATFGGERHRGSLDIMVWVCHVISQDHMTKVSSNPNLVAIGTVLMEISF